MATENHNPSVEQIIEARKGWQLINWKELVHYKDLFYFFVLRDIKVLYKQTILGFAWAIIRPFFQMIIFTIIFGKLVNVESPGDVPYAIFSYAALLPWNYFSTSLNSSIGSLISSSGIIKKVYFPRLYIPMVPVFAKLVDFCIAFIILIALMIYYQIVPNGNIIFLPLLVLLMILTASGVGLWLSAMAIQYRDIRYASEFLVQCMLYAAPVVWSAEKLIPHEYRFLYGLYPMAGVIEGFRAALLGSQTMPWDMIASGSLVAVALFLSGAMYSRRMERTFADVA